LKPLPSAHVRGFIVGLLHLMGKFSNKVIFSEVSQFTANPEYEISFMALNNMEDVKPTSFMVWNDYSNFDDSFNRKWREINFFFEGWGWSG
jgi:hypothetical protein